MRKRVFKLYLKENKGDIHFIQGRIMGIIQAVSGALEVDGKGRVSVASFARNEDNNPDYKWFKVICEDNIWEKIKKYLLEDNALYSKLITIVKE